MKTVWCFGDSWTWGSELWDKTICNEIEARDRYGNDFTVRCMENHPYVAQHRWSNILDQHPDLNVLNFSASGCSNEAIIEIINHTIDSLHYYPDYAIIAWTSQSRQSIRKVDWRNINNPSFRFDSTLPKMTDDEQEAKFHIEVCAANCLLGNSTVINIDAFFKNKTLYPLPKSVIYKNETLLGIATNFVFPEVTYFTKDLHWSYYNRTKGIMYKNLKDNGHPDENGHKLIAEYFLKELI